ncbi:MAG: NfeD family protein [Gammaproteobacteria bacterium]|nr:NfeD family protein [Gammaproteobacteria bacterium]
MAALFAHIDHWHWWILAVALLVLEAFAPGTFFMWMGISAAVVGLLVLIAPATGWEYQVFIFAVLSVASIVVWRAYFRRHPVVTDQPTLNRRGAQYVGRTFTLSEPIVNGNGKIRVDDTTWKIHGADCASGSQVQVVGVDGVILKVEEVAE